MSWLRSLIVVAVVACGSEEKAGTGSDHGGGSGGRNASGSSGMTPTMGGSTDGGSAGKAAQTAGTSGALDSRAGTSGTGTTGAGTGGNGAGTAGTATSGRGGAPSSSGSGGQAGSSDEMPNAGAAGESTECGRCSAYATSTQTGSVEPSALNALSGLALSRTQPDILFAHNDHDRPVVYALDLEGREHARITLEDAPATDIEDIAVGACGAETCVYLADVGDNAATREEYAVLRFVAPTVPASAGTMMMSAAFERFRFTYEDGSHNAESLMVAPDGTVYVVTKLAPGSGGSVAATGPSSIYRLPAPLSTSSVARATKVATLTVPKSGELAASAAAAHPCDSAFLLRTYDRVYEFAAPAGMPFEAAFAATPRTIPIQPDEPQSEAIDYRADGRGFVTSGEGTRAPIVETGCAP